MTTRRQAAYSKGGMVLGPKLTQIEAETVFGQSIPNAAWGPIELAFAAYGYGIDNLATSRPNSGKNDPQSWHRQQEAAIADLERAFDCICRVTRERTQFVLDACDNYSLQTRGLSGSLGTLKTLEDMLPQLVRAMAILERAKPMEIEVPTKATLRQRLIRQIWAALTDSGISPNLASRRGSVSLGPFERLLLALGLERGNSDEAFAQSVRRAINGAK